jgi:signal transduction histidine kinase
MENELSGFRVDLRLLLELGERLISRDEIAVIELVKNAYDADANIVNVNIESNRIEIIDDGEGMDKSDIAEGWLTIGSSYKNQHKITHKGRRVLGEKGLGRLAILRLGKKITIFTQKVNQPCYNIIFDWVNVHENLIHAKKFTSLSDFNFDTKEVHDQIFSENHGTKIIIEKLNKPWEKKGIDRLRTFLSRLLEEYDKGLIEESKKFIINYNVNGNPIPLLPPEILLNPHYYLEISVDKTGKYEGIFNWKIEKSQDSEKIEGRIPPVKKVGGKTEQFWASDPDEGCGPFVFKLNVWDLDSKEIKGSKDVLKEWSGVSLIKDTIRVIQPDSDWLGLDLRRVQNPTTRLSTNQVVGSVIITSDFNPGLIDKTDREGLLESESSKLLKKAIFIFFDLLEKRRYKLRRSKTLSKGFIFTSLDTNQLKSFKKDLPEEKREQFGEYIDNLDRYREFLEEWALGRDRMATMGLLGARLIHGTRHALMNIIQNYPIVRNSISEVPVNAREPLERMVNGAQLLSRAFNELNPFLKFRQKRAAEDIKLSVLIGSLEYLFKPDIHRNRIQVKNLINDKVILRSNKTDILLIFANLLDNSIYWIEQSSPETRIIEFRAKEDNDKIFFQIADSGPGIDSGEYDLIFETGWSQKYEGTGLGLSIVKDIVESYGGKIHADRDEILNGALFEIEMPYKAEIEKKK